ncbi:MAG: hypothetical protein AB1656_24570 [Candidatus Omnitrophota bacterium]
MSDEKQAYERFALIYPAFFSSKRFSFLSLIVKFKFYLEELFKYQAIMIIWRHGMSVAFLHDNRERLPFIRSSISYGGFAWVT